ncbi:hypothetical protein FRB90_001252 [Tulasnella sp. 427]|nr:hypothetical protein FRB90_001252 [Tulasnella sp. 427]
MVDDYPMNDEIGDAEMDDYDGYYDDAAMVDDSGAVTNQLKEYDMEGDTEAEYEQPMMVAEPADGMITEQPTLTTTTAVDVPILESLVQEESTAALETVASETPQDTTQIPTTSEAPANIEPPALPADSVDQTVKSLVQNLPTVVVPHITLYYNEQAFMLFAPQDETQDSLPSLLSGKFEFFVSPLAHFLNALRVQETQHFPEASDVVFGLEYPDLDLCIDENSKYAATYTLQNFCDALVACNHANIALTLYQVTDFEYCLKQRLEGILPDFPAEETSDPQEPPVDDPAVQSDVQIHIPETLDEEPTQVEAHSAMVANPTLQAEANETDLSQKEPQETQPMKPDPDYNETDQPVTEPVQKESETAAATVTEISEDVSATELAATIEETEEIEPLETDDSVDAFGEEDLGEPVPVEDTQTSSNDMSGHAAEGAGEESAESSATLESSVHDAAELSYEVDGQPDNEYDELHEDPSTEPADDASPEGNLIEEPSHESNEPEGAPLQVDDHEADGDGIEHDELEESEADLPLEEVDEESAAEDHQSAAPQTGSTGPSGYEDYEGYDEYDEAEDDGELEALAEDEGVDDSLLAVPDLPDVDEDPAKTPPVSAITRITPPGKRTLEERDADDEYHYGVDEAQAARESLYKQITFRGFQYGSIVAAPAYILLTLARRRPVTANSTLAATWVGGLTGAAAGYGAGYWNYKDLQDVKVTEAWAMIAYNRQQVRLNDYSTVGAVIGALLTPAIFYKRARLAHAVLGGASLGAGAGAVTHYWQGAQEYRSMSDLAKSHPSPLAKPTPVVRAAPVSNQRSS